MNNNTYEQLVNLKIYESEYVNSNRVSENDLTYTDKNGLHYKVDTKGISKQDLLIAVMTRQAYYTKRIYWLVIILVIISIVAGIIVGLNMGHYVSMM